MYGSEHEACVEREVPAELLAPERHRQEIASRQKDEGLTTSPEPGS